MNQSTAEGATPLDPDTLAGLIPDLATQEELNAFEQQNIALAVRWALRSRTLRRELLTAHGLRLLTAHGLRLLTAHGLRLLTAHGLRLLHQRMFDQTWRWAGRFRTVGTNIGVDWPQIPVQVASLCADIAYQIAEGVGEPDEQALHLHHRLAFIHPFPNGNGRHARLAADLLARQLGRPLFSWGASLGATSLVEETPARQTYLAALRAADRGDIEPLLRFARS